MASQLEAEIDRNLFAFLTELPSLLDSKRGQFALLRDQRVICVFEKLSEALENGQNSYADGLFSVQQVTDQPVELGFFSYADDFR